MKIELKGIIVFSIAFVLTSLLIIVLIICMSTEKVYSEMDCIDIYNSNTKEFDLVKNYIIEHQDGLKEYSSHMYSVDEKLKDTNPDSNTDEAIQTLYAAGVKSIHIIMDQNNRNISMCITVMMVVYGVESSGLLIELPNLSLCIQIIIYYLSIGMLRSF